MAAALVIAFIVHVDVFYATSLTVKSSKMKLPEEFKHSVALGLAG